MGRFHRPGNFSCNIWFPTIIQRSGWNRKHNSRNQRILTANGYNSSRRRGWINSIIDAAIDIVAAVTLLFFAKDLVTSVIILSVYTLASGIIDVFHGFLSTVDPTDRFIRIMAGACGCIIGIVILNAGSFEITTFARFFGAYMLIVGVTSSIYGVHNRAQNIEDKVARKQARKQKK